MLLHGPGKVGKTQLASSFPGVAFIASELGHKYLPEKIRKRVYKVTRDAEGWQRFLQLGSALAPKVKTLVVDTIGNVYYACMASVCKANGWTHPEDKRNRGWAAVRAEFIRGITALAEVCDKHNVTLILIAHSKVTHIDLSVQEYNKIELDLPGQPSGVLVPAVDHIWYYGYANTDDMTSEDSQKMVDVLKAGEHTAERWLWVAGIESIQAGTRDASITKTVVRNVPKTGQYSYIERELRK